MSDFPAELQPLLTEVAESYVRRPARDENHGVYLSIAQMATVVMGYRMYLEQPIVLVADTETGLLRLRGYYAAKLLVATIGGDGKNNDAALRGFIEGLAELSTELGVSAAAFALLLGDLRFASVEPFDRAPGVSVEHVQGDSEAHGTGRGRIPEEWLN
jgi:Mn2+/Fe2+ NRAMP family transporter